MMIPFRADPLGTIRLGFICLSMINPLAYLIRPLVTKENSFETSTPDRQRHRRTVASVVCDVAAKIFAGQNRHRIHDRKQGQIA
jgi:hypothetical protein